MGISDQVSINMKTILALLPLFALAFAQEPEACAVCRKGVDVLMKELNSKDSLAMQEQLLIEEGCKKAEDPEGCAEAVKTWWARMAKAVYTDKTSAALCKVLEPGCEESPNQLSLLPPPRNGTAKLA